MQVERKKNQWHDAGNFNANNVNGRVSFYILFTAD